MKLSNLTQLPDASLTRRIAAWIYDLFLLFAVGFAYGAIAVLVANLIGIEQDSLKLVDQGEDMTLIANESYQPAVGGPIFQSGLALVLMAFYVGFWVKRGATLGMQTWRLELIDLSGNRPTIKTCVIRALLATLSFVCFGLGYIWSLKDSNNRTAHDILSGTRVIVHPKESKRK